MHKALTLFSRTRSFETAFKHNVNWESTGVDLDNQFKPYYRAHLIGVLTILNCLEFYTARSEIN